MELRIPRTLHSFFLRHKERKYETVPISDKKRCLYDERSVFYPQQYDLKEKRDT